MLQCGNRLSRIRQLQKCMLQALLSDETLHPDVVAAGREAYSLAITHVCFHESEYSHVNPRSIGENLAKLIVCRINLGERDPRKIRDSALTELQLKK
jgi:hypothetical protein